MTERGSDLLSLQRAALEYIDQTGTLSAILEECVLYQSQQTRIFHFIIPVEPSDLLDLNAHLGNLVLNQPTSASKIFQEVVFTAVTHLGHLPQCVTVSQVVVLPRLQSLPPLPCYHMARARELLSCAARHSYVGYDGVVFSVSTRSTYTKSARFVCGEADCQGSKGDHFIRLHTAGAKESHTIRKDFSCPLCGHQLLEDIACRILGEKMVVELLDVDVLSHQDSVSSRHQTVTAFLRDDLVRELDIGQRVRVIGRPVVDHQQRSVAFEINNITHVDTFTRELRADLAIPESVQCLLHERRASAWGFVFSLAYAFGGEITPPGTYLHLKLGLMLSLVGAPSKDAGGLDLLAVGRDSRLLTRLLRYAASFADRRVIHAAGSHLVAVASKDRHSADTCFIEGGSILLAHDGVCVILSLNLLKRQMKNTLAQVLELGAVTVELPRCPGQQPHAASMTLTRRGRVWAHTDASVKESSQKVSVDKSDMSLMNCFGMVYYADIAEGSHADKMIVHQTMLHAMGVPSLSPISDSDFKQFITFVLHRPVSFSGAAEWLVRGYYVASRRVRAVTMATTALPLNAIKTLMSLAESHARLSLHSEVSEQDAVIAVYLYEEYITSQTGESVIGVRPTPHIMDNDIAAYIGQQRDDRLLQFQQQLKLFILTHNTSLPPEE